MLATTATLSGDRTGFTTIPVTFHRPDGSTGFSAGRPLPAVQRADRWLTDGIESLAGLPGKRIFINIDDDRNGLPDLIDRRVARARGGAARRAFRRGHRDGIVDDDARDLRKLSFFPNSGIKIWGIYEVAIFDTRRVAELAGVEASGTNRVTAPAYTPAEPATALMTGVAYAANESDVASGLVLADYRSDAAGGFDPIATLRANAARLHDGNAMP